MAGGVRSALVVDANRRRRKAQQHIEAQPERQITAVPQHRRRGRSRTARPEAGTRRRDAHSAPDHRLHRQPAVSAAVMTLHEVPDGLDLDTWTPIAERRRSSDDGRWARVPGAPISLRQAQRLREAGKLVQALAYTDEVETVVVKRHRLTAQ